MSDRTGGYRPRSGSQGAGRSSAATRGGTGRPASSSSRRSQWDDEPESHGRPSSRSNRDDERGYRSPRSTRGRGWNDWNDEDDESWVAPRSRRSRSSYADDGDGQRASSAARGRHAADSWNSDSEWNGGRPADSRARWDDGAPRQGRSPLLLVSLL